MRPDRLGLLGAFLALALGFLMNSHEDGGARRPAPVSPVPVGEAPVPSPAPPKLQDVFPAPAKPAPRVEPPEAMPQPRVAEAAPEVPATVPPPLPVRSPRRPSPVPDPSDWRVRMDGSEKHGNVSGTAFAVAPDAWITARHVVEDCRRVGFLDRAKKRLYPVKGAALEDPDADIALVRFDANGSPTLHLGRIPEPGATGYHYGYPGVGKGRVTSTLIGRARISGKGFRGSGAYGYAWAETRREGVGEGSLGGISGGPTLDASGRLVGVAIGGSPRRGRVISTAPWTIQHMIDIGDVASGSAAGSPWSVAPSFDEMEKAGTVRQIYCKFK